MPQRRNGHPEKASSPPDKPINRLPSEFKETAGAARQAAGEALNLAGQKADDMAASLGGSMQTLAGNLRTAMPAEKPLGQMASDVAGLLERSGRFLEQQGVSGLTNELNHLIRRNPLSALCVAVGVGFFLAQSLRR